MAFWALGKVKNISQKLNLKDYKQYGSKIIQNYMINNSKQTGQQDQQYFDFTNNSQTVTSGTATTIKGKSSQSSSSSLIKNIRNSKISSSNNRKQLLTDQQWLSIQLREYRKLSQLQQQILSTQRQLSQQHKLQQQYLQLQQQLQSIQKQQIIQKDQQQRDRLRRQIKQGGRGIQEMIRENMLLREAIQRKRGSE